MLAVLIKHGRDKFDIFMIRNSAI